MNRRRTAPTKTELMQLQKLYKTDEKIGERLGGVPAYLVAYWRRKKNIAKHSLPKFSEPEVRNLWERYGDDEKAGLELGLSKAAFYNWRRRYGIKEKPAFLKLEQLELNFPGVKTSQHSVSLYGKQTIAQKVFSRLLDVERIEVGEEITVEPDNVITQSDTGRILQQFRESGADYLWNPNKVVVSLDHHLFEAHGNGSSHFQATRDFLRRQRVKHVYDLRDGICHQVVIEKGLALPGQLILGTDDLSVIHGAVGALGIPYRSEAIANVWAHGEASIKVPDSVRLSITGRRNRAIAARDIMLAVKRQVGDHALSGKVIEYGGSIVGQMTQSERMAVAAFSAELHAAGALLPYDATTRRYLAGRYPSGYKPVIPDKNAEYSDLLQVSIDHLSPLVQCPTSGDHIKAAGELEGVTVSLIVIGSLTSGRFDDLRVVADILKGKQVHADCRLLVMPASRAVYLEALNKGLVRVLVEAGAVILASGSSGMLSLAGALADGERCLTTTCSTQSLALKQSKADIYYCSPATAAVSALHASITDPTRFVR
ncbi:MAG: aconitase family protein [candidate division Zixibacteria bacterium]|nr:aconitase family protein [candidate division Zixibacteria bacterium]